MNFILSIIKSLLLEIYLKLQRLMIKNSEAKILELKNNLEKEELYYNSLIKGSLEWCNNQQPETVENN